MEHQIQIIDGTVRCRKYTGDNCTLSLFAKVQSIPVLMKVEGAVSDISQTLEGIFALQNQLGEPTFIYEPNRPLCLTFKRHILSLTWS